MTSSAGHVAPNAALLQALREEVVACLKTVNSLLRQAAVPLDKPSQYIKHATLVENELRKVNDLELRMAIVAPMKAGKSTIINAILGRPILPARNSAMTTIPTEIVCEPGMKTPTLTVDDTTAQTIQTVWTGIYDHIRMQSDGSVDAALARYPELTGLKERVSQTRNLAIPRSVSGTTAVQEWLLLLNDFCRLASAIDANKSVFSYASFAAPRIAVDFLRVHGHAKHADGKLVIVDTPGPNEAHQHGALLRVVEDQLRSTSLVLLVLDFTQLNTEAAEKMSRSVRAVVRTVGEDNLFVLVNKVDERNDGSMTVDQVRQFVAAHLHLKLSGPADRIFEVSARQALAAATFLHDLEDLGPEADLAQLRDLPSARELAPIVFGAVNWKEDLADASSEKLRKRASALWLKSEFDNFLERAIEKVMSEVAPRCLTVAMRIARAQLLTLKNDISLRRKAIVVDAAVLESELSQLQTELSNLDASRKSIDSKMRSVRKELADHLGSTRRSLQKGILVSIAEIFKSESLDREGFWKKLRRFGKNLLLLPTTETAIPTVIPFKTQAAADEFAQEALALAFDLVRPHIEDALARVDRRVESSRFELEAAIEAETRPILSRAATRLKRQFDVHLEVPRPDLGNPLESIMVPENLADRIDGGYREETRMERKWWVLWLWHVPVTYQIKLDDHFSVSLEQIAQTLDIAIRDQLEATALRFGEYLDGDFADRVAAYFRSLTEYLKFYRDSIQSAQNAQSQSLDERNSLRETLSLLHDATGREFDNAERLLLQLEGQEPERRNVDLFGSAPLPVDAFISYSHKDEQIRVELQAHLSTLHREGKIRTWHDRMLGAGDDWRDQIDSHLETSKIVLLLVSADFLASDYCMDKEMTRAMERHAAGDAKVVPIIVRACDWLHAPFSHLQALPHDGQPIVSWSDRDAVLHQVALGIRSVLDTVADGDAFTANEK